MRVRRVVTGHDRDGRAVFVSDSEVDGIRPALMPGGEFHRLWGGDETPRYPDDGSPPDAHDYFPPVGGFRFGIFTLPPERAAGPLPGGLDVGAALAELEAQLPGLTAPLEPDDLGMHTTATIDFEIVLAGAVTLELDDGAKVRLGTGDTVVQNGTRHRWTNDGDVPVTIAVFICGAHHERLGPAKA